MGFKEMTAVVDNVRGLKSSAKFCLAMIADRVYPQPEKYGDHIPRAEIFVDELCRRTEQSRATVHRHLAELEKCGLIFRDCRWGVDQNGHTTRSASLVALNIDAITRGDFQDDGKNAGQAVSLKMRHTKNPFDKGAGQAVSLKMRHTKNDMDRKSQNEKPCVSKDGSVSLTGETYNYETNKTSLPPKPPVRKKRDRRSSDSSTGEPSGSRGGEETLHEWTDRLRTISLALIGEAVLPDGVTNDELQAVRELEAQQLAHAAEASPEAASDVITPVEAEMPSTDDVASESAVLGQEAPTAERGEAAGLSQAELVTLAREVLPAPMQAMGPHHLARIGHAIDQRLHAGWSKGDVTLILAMRQLPSNVRNLTGLVMARLRDDVPLDQPPISAGLGQHSSFEAPLMPSRKMAPEKRSAIDACELCDDNGFAPTPDGTAVMRCTHNACKEAI